ncbi:MAG: branched-chain amino acid aminotransferase [Bacteriovoracaceae bacterium]|jgi:branched-chain amino acid aminotransferase
MLSGRWIIKLINSVKEIDIKNFKYEPNPSFGTAQVPIVLWCDIGKKETSPEKVELTSNMNLSLSYFSSVLHYGQAIFEGLKAYRLVDGKISIFRLRDHAKRFKNSAKIMGLPEIDEDVFVECIEKFVKACEKMVPSEEGHSLYIRPLMFANDSMIKVRSGENFRFAVMASVVGPYFTSGNIGSRILVNKNFVRAFSFGTGEAKTAANYALSLPALQYAQANGFEQVLYLDATTKTKIDELGGMNFFLIKEGKIITPKLNGTILAGVTRNCIIEIAKHLGIAIEERDITLSEVLGTPDKNCVFACGTAATVVPIVEIGTQDNFDDEIKCYKFFVSPILEQIRNELISAQSGNSPLSKKWLTYIN